MPEEKDYDDPAAEQEWLDEQEELVRGYLDEQSVGHDGEIDIEWCLAPYVSLWTVSQPSRPLKTWVISGDLPTDYIEGKQVTDARSAARAFAQRWAEVSSHMLDGKSHPSMRIGNPNDPEQQKELGDLLQRRVRILLEWVEDDALWEEQ